MMVKNILIINIEIINHYHLEDNSNPGLWEGYDGQHQHQDHLEDNGRPGLCEGYDCGLLGLEPLGQLHRNIPADR